MVRQERRGLFGRARRWLGGGVQDALELMRLGRLTPQMNAPFDVVDRDAIHKLRRYKRPEGLTHPKAPLVLVPPLMLTADIYDISPDLSAVLPMVTAGLDVWIVDFGAPEVEEGGMDRTLDDHVRAVAKAVRTVRRITGADVHLGGYSQGGMFCYQAAALLRSEHIASVVTFGSPVDVHLSLPAMNADATAALLRVVQRVIDRPLEQLDGLPGALTSTAFKLLSPRKEIEQLIDLVRQLKNREELQKRAVRRRFLGGGGFVSWPGPAFRTFVDQVIVHNRMLQGGIVIDGQTITLADIRTPILSVIGTRDDIARPPAVRAIRRAAPMAEVHELYVDAGHFGLVVGSRALRETWPSVVEWVKWREDLGPAPALIDRAPKKGKRAGARRKEENSVELDLLLETAAAAVASAWKGLSDVLRDTSESAGALRYQVPRLRRLERLTPDTRVSLSAELAERAKESPDATFFIWQGRAFSFRDADERVSNVVRGLYGEGVRPGARVLVVMKGRPSMLSAVTAVARLGGVAVVVPPSASDDELARAAREAEVDAVVSDPEHGPRVGRVLGRTVMVLGGGSEARHLGSGIVDLERVDPKAITLPTDLSLDSGLARDLALVLYTRGARGELRASRVTNHRWAMSAVGAAAACTLSPHDTVYACLPLHHPAGLLVTVGAALVGGARLALGSPFAPDTFWTEVRRYGASVVFYAGEMVRGLLTAPVSSIERNHPLRLLAGSGMRADLARDVVDRFGVGVLEFYGSTSFPVVLANASGEKPGALGRPLPGSAAIALVRYDAAEGTIVRDARGRAVECGDDEVGAVLATVGPHVADASIDEARLVRDAFAEGDRHFLLADLMRRDGDGDFHYVEARGNVVVVDGTPVFPRIVEDALYRVPGVTAVVVQPVGSPVELIATLAASPPPDATVVAQALASIPEEARPAQLHVVGEMPMTDGFRPIAPRYESAPTSPHSVLVLDDGGDGEWAPPETVR